MKIIQKILEIKRSELNGLRLYDMDDSEINLRIFSFNLLLLLLLLLLSFILFILISLIDEKYCDGILFQPKYNDGIIFNSYT